VQYPLHQFFPMAIGCDYFRHSRKGLAGYYLNQNDIATHEALKTSILSDCEL
jgi:hypothetical protein